MSSAPTSSIAIATTIPAESEAASGTTQPVIPFVFDTAYKGDEIASHAARILDLKDARGWEVTDADEDTAMVHYTKDADMSTHGYLRGILVDREVDAIIADSFGYTPTAVAVELVPRDGRLSIKDSDGVTHNFDMTDTIIKPVFEGVVLRILWRKSKLYRITHSRIDTSRSRWGSSKYFVSMYEEAGGPTVEQLFDTSKPFSNTVYDFLVVHPSLLVGTRQKVKKPYIAFLAQRTMDIKRPADQVAPGRANFTTTSTIGWCVEESVIHEPKALTLDEANRHLKYGYYNEFTVDDPRQLTGEAVIVYRMRDGVVSDIVKVHSPAYDWRVKKRGNNANVVNQFYCLLNSVYGDVNTPEAWTALKENLILLPLYDEQSLKNLHAQSDGLLMIPSGEVTPEDYGTRDERIHLLWMNYMLSLPPHMQAEALNLLSQFKKDRTDLTIWLQELEETTKNIEATDVSDRVKGLISSARRLARERIANGDNYSAKGAYMKLPVVIKSTLRNLINKENGPSLYSRIREFKEAKMLKQ